MNDIFNLIVHFSFFLVGVGTGCAVGVSVLVFKNLALDATHKIEHAAVDATHGIEQRVHGIHAPHTTPE